MRPQIQAGFASRSPLVVKLFRSAPASFFSSAWALQVVAVSAEALNVKSDRTARAIALIVTSSVARGQTNDRPMLGLSKHDHAAAPNGRARSRLGELCGEMGDGGVRRRRIVAVAKTARTSRRSDTPWRRLLPLSHSARSIWSMIH